MEKKKVVQFIHSLTTGGAETLVKDYALLLDKDKYDVTVLCYDHRPTPYDKILADAGIPVIYVDDKMKLRAGGVVGKLLSSVQRYFLVRYYFHKLDPDIVHVHHTINRLVHFADLDSKTRVVCTVHSDPQKCWFANKSSDKGELKAAKQNIKKYGMRFIVLHENMRKEVNEIFGVDDSIVLNNGVDFSRFDGIGITKAEEREKLSIPSDAFVMLHTGRFTQAKNHTFLVDVFSEAVKRNSKAFLLMIGTGELKKKITEKLDGLGLSGKYMILENRTDIPEILKAADCFVFPSLWEGLPVSMIEAQKSELPCFISDKITGDVIISNYVTVLPADNNAEEWADTILNYEKPKLEYCGIEDWDMKNVIRRLEKIYEGEI